MKITRFRFPFFWLVAPVFLSCSENRPKPAQPDFTQQIISGHKELTLADTLWNQGQAEDAFSHYQRARKLLEPTADSVSTSYVLLKMADIMHQYNDYNEMQSYTVEAQQHLPKTADPEYSTSIFNNYGLSHMFLENFPMALESYRKAMKVTRDSVSRLTALGNIGYTYINAGKFQQGREVLQRAMKSAYIDKNPLKKATIQDNLGYASFRISKPEGVPLMQQALSLRLEADDKFDAVASYIHLSEALLQTDRSQALEYAKKAELLSRETHSANDRLQALKILTQNSALAESNRYATQFILVNDSIQMARKKVLNSFAQMKYDYKMEREEKLELQTDNINLELRQSQLENTRLLLILAAVLIAFSAAALIGFIIRRNKKNRWRASYETESRIATRLHDELANDLHQTIVFTESKNLSEGINREKLLDDLDTLYRRTRQISRENAQLDNSRPFQEHVRELASAYNTENQKIILAGLDDVGWEKIEEHKKVALHRVLQELLVNMKKHSDCSRALLKFELRGKIVAITYADNGKGIPEGLANKHGLMITENRMNAIKGTITFDDDSGKGFRAQLEFPA